MQDLIDLDVAPAPVDHGPGQRIECAGICHNGPIDDSPRALRNAVEHDPNAPAAFLYICPACDAQTPLCEKKVDALLESALLGSGFGKAECGVRVPISRADFLPLNRG